MPAEVLFSSLDVYAEAEKSIRLNCNHIGAPKPTVTWFTPKNLKLRFYPPSTTANSNSTTKSKYRVNENGDLEIENLNLNDTGLYQCSVSNQFSLGFSKKRQGTVLLEINCKIKM